MNTLEREKEGEEEKRDLRRTRREMYGADDYSCWAWCSHSTFCLGSALKLTFPYDWSWKTSLLLGGLLSATDPVAVVALLKELGASKKLCTIIEGESLMNDGMAIVVYQLYYRIVFGESFSFGAIVEFLMKVSLGAHIGLAFEIASVLWLGFIFNDTVIEIALTLTVSYIAFFTLVRVSLMKYFHIKWA
ncbi:hypothetical protein RHMOL_Rhmol10G0281000 [Rhododendron molle]|uniref:Uncharacterized protein n=1 Tax=Rhododendron molle TaxID=49168 RepID=A0ACC0M7K1_RHOML|nr:hypothetical protein RHMOL_Rhmol10G0281000 [Rhododendron molle]